MMNPSNLFQMIENKYL